MKKEGFTLIELLLVLVIVATITASTSIIFSQLTEKNTEEELENLYLSIQRSAKTYVDLNDSWSKDFYNNKNIYIALSVLENSDYINRELINPITNEEIDRSYVVRMCVANDDPTGLDKKEYNYVDTCILGKENNNDICIANSEGINKNCCSKCNSN